MNYLLDTHVLLWLEGSPERIPARTRRLLADAETVRFVSIASTWELAIKAGLGKIRTRAPLGEFIERLHREAGVTELAITREHAVAVAELPPHHRDPFDRLLVAQAQIEGLTLVSADPQLSKYDVKLVRV